MVLSGEPFPLQTSEFALRAEEVETGELEDVPFLRLKLPESGEMQGVDGLAFQVLWGSTQWESLGLEPREAPAGL